MQDVQYRTGSEYVGVTRTVWCTGEDVPANFGWLIVFQHRKSQAVRYGNNYIGTERRQSECGFPFRRTASFNHTGINVSDGA